RLAVPVAKGAAEALGRKAMTQTAEQIAAKAAAKEAAEAGARAASKKVVSKVLKGGATKLAGGLVGGPVTEVVMAAWTAYDIVTIIPDLVKITGGLISHVGDLKFPGDSYRNGAFELDTNATNGKPAVTLSPESCEC